MRMRELEKNQLKKKKPFIYFLVNNNRKNEEIRNQIIT